MHRGKLVVFALGMSVSIVASAVLPDQNITGYAVYAQVAEPETDEKITTQAAEETEPESEMEAEIAPKSEVEAETESEDDEVETEAETESEDDEVETEIETESEDEVETEAETESENEAEIETEYESEAETTLEDEIETEIEYETIEEETKVYYESLQEHVNAVIDAYLSREAVVELGDHKESYPVKELGLTWINPEVVSKMEQFFLNKQCQTMELPESYAPQYDVNPNIIIPFVSALIEQESIEAQNGNLVKENGSLFVTEGTPGRSFSLEKIIPAFVEVLKAQREDEEIVLSAEYTVVEPAISSKTVSFSEKPIGEYITYNLGVPGRVNNIERSAGGINGTFVMPGEAFSALTMYGAVTAENGYQSAPTYNGGRQIPGIGGGICQTTTTLYNACLRAELEIVLRRQHSMLVSYVPPSLDAMVDYATNSDFIARNNTGYPIYLEGETGIDQDGDSYVCIRIWGTETRPANRSVSYEYEVLACKFPDTLFRENLVNDSVTTPGLVMPNFKIYAEVEAHPFVQSRAYKVVTVDGVVQSRTPLPGGYGSYDQYKEMPGTIYHASDCQVTYWVVPDENTYLKQRVHYEVLFCNGRPWHPQDPEGNYGK